MSKAAKKLQPYTPDEMSNIIKKWEAGAYLSLSAADLRAILNRALATVVAQANAYAKGMTEDVILRNRTTKLLMALVHARGGKTVVEQKDVDEVATGRWLLDQDVTEDPDTKAKRVHLSLRAQDAKKALIVLTDKAGA